MVKKKKNFTSNELPLSYLLEHGNISSSRHLVSK